ncbi:spore germination protein GerW family protein [Actinoplanes sp. NPDC049118]|uniref:spore germination protein GerW family protein n=1 Tax=Actinoplanes sp. NPDC049118 TaxID=3155769 RepID=UPI0033D7F0C4
MTTTTKDAPILDTLRDVVDNATVGRAFGSPIHHDDMVVLPVAKVGGGGGGGSGSGSGSGSGPAPDGQENGGTGGGFGMSAKPLGVFVLKNGKVAWRPAIDVNRIVLGGQIVAVTGLLVIRALIKAGVVHPRRRGLIEQIAREADGKRRTAVATLHRLERFARHTTR